MRRLAGVRCSSLLLASLLALLLLAVTSYSLFAQVDPARPWPPTEDPPPIPAALVPYDEIPRDPTLPITLPYPAWEISAFASLRSGTWELYLRGGYTTYLQQLTFTPADDEARPALHPEATHLLFDADRDQNGVREISMLNLANPTQKVLIAPPGGAWDAAWAADGASFVFVTRANGQLDIMRYDFASREVTPLAATDADEFDPTFRPTGEVIFVRRASAHEGRLMQIVPATGEETEVLGFAPYVQAVDVALDNRMIGFSLDTNQDGLVEVAVLRDGVVKALPLANSATEDGRCEFIFNTWMPRFETGDTSQYFGSAFHFALNKLCYSSTTAERTLATSTLEEHPHASTATATMHPGYYEAAMDWVGVDRDAPRVILPDLGYYTPIDCCYALFASADDASGPQSGQVIYHWQVTQGKIYKEGGFHASPRSEEIIAPCMRNGFRVRVRDAAGNWSAWTEWQFTTGYWKRVDGRVRDVRNIPLPEVAIAALPDAVETDIISDATGAYSAHLCTRENAAVAANPFSPQWAASAALPVVWTENPVAYDHVIHARSGLVLAEHFDEPHVDSLRTSFHSPAYTDNGFTGGGLHAISTCNAGDRSCAHTWQIVKTREPSDGREHGLTLSFMARVANSYSQSVLAVAVQDESARPATTVYTMTLENQGWTNHFAPLDLHLGDVITLTFTIESPFPGASAEVTLDDLLISSWWTPAIDHVYQPGGQRTRDWQRTAVEPGSTVTVVGENFLAPVSVAISDGVTRWEATDVLLKDDATLSLYIPEALPQGLYALLVTNQVGTPEQITAAKPAAIAVEDALWFPLLGVPLTY